MSFLDWIYPPVCMACKTIIPMHRSRQRSLWLCGACEDLFDALSPPLCGKCGGPSPGAECSSCYGKTFFFAQNRAAFIYEGLLRDIIIEMKFKNKKYMAAGLGRLWADTFSEGTFPAGDYIVPVPLHPRKKRRRGFNHAEILAGFLSEKFAVPLAAELLCRTKDTPPQSGLSLRGRMENVEGVFRVHGKNIKNKKIILIDDIFTTGASINECAKTLCLHGAETADISCMTLTITVKNND